MPKNVCSIFKNVTIQERKIMGVYMAMVAFIIIFVIYSYATEYPRLGFASDEYAEWTDGWQVLLDDGTYVDITLPYKEDVTLGEIKTFRAIIPEDSYADRYIFIKSAHQNIKIYIDGEEFYSYVFSTKQRVNEKFAPSLWLRISLPEEYSGREMTVEVETLQNDGSPVMNTIFIGESVAVFYRIIRLSALPVLLASIVLFFGLLLIVYWIANLYSDTHLHGVIYIAFSAIFGGLWLISQSSARQLIFQNILLVRNMEFMSVMMIPVPTILSLDITEEKKDHAAAMEACTLIFVVDILCFLLVFVGGVNFLDILWIIYCTIGIAGTWAVVSFYRIYKNYRSLFKTKFRTLVAYAILLISGLLEMSMLSTNYQGYFLPFGMMIFFWGMLREQVAAQNRAFDARMRAEAQNSAKSEFLASMSHEIRSPLNAILGMDEMILRESKENNILAYATDINTAGQSLLKIINQILDFSKIEAGRVKLTNEEYDLGDLLQQVISLIRVQAENKGLKLIVDIDKTVPKALIGDSGRIKQMLINLLNNAVKYTEHGSVTLMVYFKDNADASKKNICFEVADTGKGISAENIDKIYERFQRITGNDSGRVEGTGLGLAITKQMVELMEGSITVESTVGKGTVFRMIIPQQVADFEAIGNFEKDNVETPKVEKYHESFTAESAKILVVDDNEINLRLVESFLKKTKVQLDTAKSGVECIEKVKSNSYDLILLDDLMPEMDGRETLDHLKNDSDLNVKNVPIICFTANAIAGSRDDYMEYGFDDYIAKPVTGDILEKTVSRWLPSDKVEKYSAVAAKGEGGDVKVETESRLVDYSIGLDYCMNDKSTYIEVLKLFVESAKDRKDKLIEDYKNKDMKGYVVRTHGLKSTALTIGAISLSELCKDLEYAGKHCQNQENVEENLEFIRNNNENMLDLFDQTVAECHEYLRKCNV